VSVQRIYVHAELKQTFIDRLAARIKQLRVGDPTRADTDFGPLITPDEADRVEIWIDEAVRAGAHRIGGERLSKTTLKPTILVDPPRNAKVSTHEIFGPVTCVYGFDEIDEAIAAANSLPVAFQASIFTCDLDVALDAAERLDASAVMVNDHSAFRTDWMPFAGRRESGYGIGGIPYTAAEMTAEKMIVFKPLSNDRAQPAKPRSRNSTYFGLGVA
jgi:acyl-CoA reductase-like NAD-dependent aldehyde dehydrogenase